MERIPKATDTPEFRAEAVKLVESSGMSVAKAADQRSWLHRRSAGAGQRSAIAISVALKASAPSNVPAGHAQVRKRIHIFSIRCHAVPGH